MYALVGMYARKICRGGMVRLPKEWLAGMGDPAHMFIVPDRESGELHLVPPTESGIPESAVSVGINRQGAIRLTAEMRSFIGAGDTVVLRGMIRTIVVCAG